MTNTRSILSRFLFIVPFLVVFSGGWSQPASGQSLQEEDVLRSLRTKYDTMVSMSAAFDQTTSSDFMDTDERYRGHILLSGDAYRIEMPAQTIVTDTQLTWVYNATESQVLINNYVDDETTFSLSRFLSEFDTAYSVQSIEETADGPTVVLIPNDEFSSFLSVQMWIRSSDGIVNRLRVVDVNDVEMLFDLSDIVFNPTVPENSFRFITPAGVEEIDLREN